MQDIGKLSELTQGRRAKVVDIFSDDGMRRRLQDLGLIKGTEVTCVQKSPLGDPVAFLIRGAVIALRYDDSSRVKIQYIYSAENNDWAEGRLLPEPQCASGTRFASERAQAHEGEPQGQKSF